MVVASLKRKAFSQVLGAAVLGSGDAGHTAANGRLVRK